MRHSRNLILYTIYFIHTISLSFKYIKSFQIYNIHTNITYFSKMPYFSQILYLSNMKHISHIHKIFQICPIYLKYIYVSNTSNVQNFTNLFYQTSYLRIYVRSLYLFFKGLVNFTFELRLDIELIVCVSFLMFSDCFSSFSTDATDPLLICDLILKIY